MATYNADGAVTFGGTTLTHDFNENLTSDGGATYVWDARDRLTSLTAAGITASFRYDASGRRLGKTVNGPTTTVLHDGLEATQVSFESGLYSPQAGIGYTYGWQLARIPFFRVAGGC